MHQRMSVGEETNHQAHPAGGRDSYTLEYNNAPELIDIRIIRS